MSRLVTFATAAAVILVVSAATLFVGGTDVGAQLLFNATPVLVVNDTTAPVIVSDGEGARTPFRKWVVIHLDEKEYRSEPLAMVPKGFRLHVTDINFFGCSAALKDDMAVNLTLWPMDYPGEANPDVPPATDEIPRTALMILPRGVFQGMQHFGGSQQPNIFADQGEQVWVEVYRSSARRHAEGAIWVQGFLQEIGKRGKEIPPKESW
jgi:hypothetical protein